MNAISAKAIVPECDGRVCDQCGWTGKASDLVSAPDPFDEDQTIHACPRCRVVEGTTRVKCYVAGCLSVATCGRMTELGYRLTCGQHTADK